MNMGIPTRWALVIHGVIPELDRSYHRSKWPYNLVIHNPPLLTCRIYFTPSYNCMILEGPTLLGIPKLPRADPTESAYICLENFHDDLVLKLRRCLEFVVFQWWRTILFWVQRQILWEIQKCRKLKRYNLLTSTLWYWGSDLEPGDDVFFLVLNEERFRTNKQKSTKSQGAAKITHNNWWISVVVRKPSKTTRCWFYIFLIHPALYYQTYDQFFLLYQVVCWLPFLRQDMFFFSDDDWKKTR